METAIYGVVVEGYGVLKMTVGGRIIRARGRYLWDSKGLGGLGEGRVGSRRPRGSGDSTEYAREPRTKGIFSSYTLGAPQVPVGGVAS